MNSRCEDEIPLKRSRRQGPGRPKQPKSAPPRIPRTTRLMALAIKFEDMISRGDVKDYADLARLGLVTRARLTQIMGLLLLAPQIQEQLLFCSLDVAEREIRKIVSSTHWCEQERVLSKSLQGVRLE